MSELIGIICLIIALTIGTHQGYKIGVDVTKEQMIRYCAQNPIKCKQEYNIIEQHKKLLEGRKKLNNVNNFGI